MNEQYKATLRNEKSELEEIAKLLKQLSPKEKERVLYTIQGIKMADEVVAAKTVGA